MNERTDASIPAWQAYGDLFMEVRERQKPKWSFDNLVDALNEDADSKNRPKCKYSRRSLEGYQTNPIKKKSARRPRPDRQEHLHEFLSEQLTIVGRAEKCALKLAAIAPPDLSGNDMEFQSRTVSPERRDIESSQGKILKMDDVADTLYNLLQMKLAGKLSAKPEGNLSGSSPNHSEPINPGQPTRGSKRQFGRAGTVEKYLLERSRIEMDAGQFGNSGQILQQLGGIKLSRTEKLSVRRRPAIMEAANLLYLGGVGLAFERRFDEALGPVSLAIDRASRNRHFDVAGHLQLRLGDLHFEIVRRVQGHLALEHKRHALAAYRSAVKHFCSKHSPREWGSAQRRIGELLADQAVRNKAKTASRLFTEAADAFGAALRVCKGEAYADVALRLGEVLKAHGELYSSDYLRPASIPTDGMLQEAVELYRNALKAIGQNKYPELWSSLQRELGHALMFQAARVSSIHSTTNWKPTATQLCKESRAALVKAFAAAVKNKGSGLGQIEECFVKLQELERLLF